MKTDDLFHEFFQLAPQALFELLQITPGCAYRFSSPVVKASERRMDGLLEPVESGHPRYFVEVQGYEDKSIYWRVIHQVSLYYQQRPNLNGSDWRIILLFLDASHDPGPETLGPFYHSDRSWLIKGIVPDLLQQASSPSPILNVLCPLITRDEIELHHRAAGWVKEIRRLSGFDRATQERLLALLAQFIVQKFTLLTRKEIETMLKLTPIEETVAGREWIQEGQISILAEQIEQKFAIPGSMAAQSLASLSVETLKELSRRILEIETATQLAAWLEAHKSDIE
jgi:predicted transposase YdaD